MVGSNIKLDVVGGVRTQQLSINNDQVSEPTVGEVGGDGTRVVLSPGTAAATPYALGCGSSAMWSCVPDNSLHQWYNGSNITTQLQRGNFTTTGRVTASAITAGWREIVSTDGLIDGSNLAPNSIYGSAITAGAVNSTHLAPARHHPRGRPL